MKDQPTLEESLEAQSGLFGISADHLQSYQSLDERFIKNRASTFFFQAASDAMAPLIQVNDVLIVDRAIVGLHNRVVVLSLDGEMICRKWFQYRYQVLLKAFNEQYKTEVIKQEREMCVFGVVTGLARDIFS